MAYKIISVDFTEVDAPSAKQIDFVQEICNTLNIPKPVEYTRDSYSDFISKNIEEFKDEQYFSSEGRGFYDW